MFWTDGSKYLGHWEAGVQNGVGIMIFPDGVKRAGFFEKNVFQVPLKNKEQYSEIEEEIPEEIRNELELFLREREAKAEQLRA